MWKCAKKVHSLINKESIIVWPAASLLRKACCIFALTIEAFVWWSIREPIVFNFLKVAMNIVPGFTRFMLIKYFLKKIVWASPCFVFTAWHDIHRLYRVFLESHSKRIANRGFEFMFEKLQKFMCNKLLFWARFLKISQKPIFEGFWGVIWDLTTTCNSTRVLMVLKCKLGPFFCPY